jgi:hypothetical protein
LSFAALFRWQWIGDAGRAELIASQTLHGSSAGAAPTRLHPASLLHEVFVATEAFNLAILALP